MSFRRMRDRRCRCIIFRSKGDQRRVIVLIPLLYMFRKKLPGKGLIQNGALSILALGPLSMSAIWLGWFLAEIGRRPWIVRGYMKVSDAATTSTSVGWMLVLFIILYLVLSVSAIRVLSQLFRNKSAEEEIRSLGLEIEGRPQMSYAMVAITVLWTFLFGYLLVASIDFGAGFFSYYSVLTGHENKIHNIIQRYLSPVWEVTNVFLIFLWSDLSDSFRMPRIIMAPPCLCRRLACAGDPRRLLRLSHVWRPDREQYRVYGALRGTGLLIPARCRRYWPSRKAALSIWITGR